MFKKWPKIPRLENEVFHITEKIDGTNGCVVIRPCSWMTDIYPPLYHINDIGIWAQSRTRIITREADNYEFAMWVRDNSEQLMNDLGIGYHYGEWWGKGINREYGITHRRFSLFNRDKQSSACENVPYLARSNFDTLHYDITRLKTELLNFGSLAAKGFCRPEGLVVYAALARTSWKVIIDK